MKYFGVPSKGAPEGQEHLAEPCMQLRSGKWHPNPNNLTICERIKRSPECGVFAASACSLCKASFRTASLLEPLSASMNAVMQKCFEPWLNLPEPDSTFGTVQQSMDSLSRVLLSVPWSSVQDTAAQAMNGSCPMMWRGTAVGTSAGCDCNSSSPTRQFPLQTSMFIC